MRSPALQVRPRHNAGRRLAAGLLLPLTLAACGSTVQSSTTATQAGDVALGGSTGLGAGPASAAGPTGAVSPDGTSTVAGGTSTTGGTSTAPGTTTGSTLPGSTPGGGPAPVVSRGTGPIKIGVVLTDTGQASDYGFSNGETYSERQIDDALFNALNAAGGIDGRKLVPIYARTNPYNANWSADFATACATFTQDNKVEAVLSYVFNYDQAFATCLTKRGIPHLSTSFNIPDVKELAKHPLHRAMSVPTIDQRTNLKLVNAVKDGVLTTKNKVGVVIDTCPGSEESHARVTEPFLNRNKIPFLLYKDSCSTGTNASTAEKINSVNGVLLRFREAGVDTLMFNAASEGPALAVVTTAAESQGWRPTYLVSSLANLSALEAQVPAAQLANVKGYGWMPAQDLGATRQPPPWAGQKRCLQLLRASGVIPRNFGDFANAYRICTSVLAYEAAVRRNGGGTSGSAVIQGLEAVGSGFSSPDVLDGASLFGSGRENVAPSRLRRILWDTSCNCFGYVGPARPLG